MNKNKGGTEIKSVCSQRIPEKNNGREHDIDKPVKFPVLKNTVALQVQKNITYFKFDLSGFIQR